MTRNTTAQGNPFEETYRMVKGLCLRPVTMRHYAEWLDAKPALTLRLSTLPPRLAVLPYASAMFKLEAEAALAGQPAGILSRFVTLLCLSLGIEARDAGNAVRFIVDKSDLTELKGISVFLPRERTERVYCDGSGTFRLSHRALARNGNSAACCRAEGHDGEMLEFSVEQDGQTVQAGYFLGDAISVTYLADPDEPTATLRPLDVTAIRQAIADLNGEKLPDESENPELVDALRQKNELGAGRLRPDLSGLVDAVAMLSGKRTAELADWTVCEFERRRHTQDRLLRFLLCGVGEMQGARWKNGNPYPSWCFDRETDRYGGFTPVSDVLSTLGTSESWLNGQIAARDQNT